MPLPVDPEVEVDMGHGNLRLISNAKESLTEKS